MNEQQTIKKYKTWLTVVSILLAAVLFAQGVYMAGGFGRSGQDKPAAEEPQEQASAADEAQASEEAAAPAPAEETGAQNAPEGTEKAAAQSEEIPGSLSHDGYTLEQVVIFSRHNIRSPLSGSGSAADTMTPHKWFEWSTGTSELSIRGGNMETHTGQFFRKWLEAEGLFPTNYHPAEGEVRIYANAKQRTIATAQYFAAGLLPTANMPVEYHGEFDTMYPEFTPATTFWSAEYEEAVKNQIDEIYGERLRGLKDRYDMIKDIIDFEESEAYKSGAITEFSLDDMEITYAAGEEPKMTGTLKTACSISDALILQYYEESDEQKAAFGKTLTQEQWKQVSEVKDLYTDVLFSVPLASYNVAHPQLQLIQSELTQEGRKFSFLCGHDSNVASILSALQCEEYVLPETVENTTPIGGKIVLSKWTNEAGEQLVSVDLVYASAQQLRDLTLLDLKTPPMVVPLTLKGLEKNADGLYKYEDVLQRFDEAISEYDKIVEEYSEQEMDQAA